MYVDFKEVVVALYHQANDEEEEPEPSTFLEREVEWEQKISESDYKDFEGKYGSGDDYADDDADDEHLLLSNTMVACRHPFGEPSFVRALDFEAMHTSEFPKYANLGM